MIRIIISNKKHTKNNLPSKDLLHLKLTKT